MIRVSRATGLCILLSALAIAEAHAAHSWSDPAGGLYSDAGNWSGGIPLSGQSVSYSVNGSYTVNVDGAASHGATQFAANDADVTLNITGPGYTIAGLTQIGVPAGENNVVVGGATLSTQDIEIAPFAGLASLTVNGPMQSGIVFVGGRISTDSGPPWPLQNPGGAGTLTLNAGANLSAEALLAESSGNGSQIIFNGGTMTIAGHARPRAALNRIGDGTSAAVLNLFDGDEPGHHSFGAATLIVSNNAVVNYNSPDGDLIVGNIVNDGGSTPGVFNWIAGYLSLLSAPFEVSAGSIFGSNVELSDTRRLSAPSVVIDSGASLTLNGADLFTDSLVTDPGGTLTFTRGKLFVNTGDLSIGPGGITNPTPLTLEENDFLAVESGALLVAAGRSLELNGGGLRAKSLANSGLVAFQSGYIDLQGGDLTIGPLGQVNNSPNLSIGSNSVIRTWEGEIEIQSGQTIAIDGGGLVAGYLTNNGTLLFHSGVLALTHSDLTIGPTGQLRHQPVLTLDNGSSIQMFGRAVTIQAGQTVNLHSGYIYVGNLHVDGTLHINDDISFTTMTTGPAGNVSVGSNAYVLGGTFVRRNLVVGGGSLIFNELSTPTAGMENHGFTLNGGSVYADTLKVGAAPGYVDTVTINGGSLTTLNLQATGGASSVIVFNAGRFTSFSSNVDGPGAFVVGNGTSEAEFAIGSERTHNFADGIAISPNGVLRGGGTINGDIANAGRLEPGYAFGDLVINGDLTNTGVLELEFSSPGFADRIIVNGEFDAGGVIKVVAYDLHIGDTYDLFDFTGLVDSGYTFDFTAAAPLPGSHWDTSEFTTSGRLFLVADNGDFNQDGVVDTADYVAWRKGLGAPATSENYDSWSANYGQNSGVASNPPDGVVPEPKSLAMLVGGIVAALSRRRANGSRPNC